MHISTETSTDSSAAPRGSCSCSTQRFLLEDSEVPAAAAPRGARTHAHAAGVAPAALRPAPPAGSVEPPLLRAQAGVGLGALPPSAWDPCPSCPSRHLGSNLHPSRCLRPADGPQRGAGLLLVFVSTEDGGPAARTRCPAQGPHVESADRSRTRTGASPAWTCLRFSLASLSRTSERCCRLLAWMCQYGTKSQRAGSHAWTNEHRAADTRRTLVSFNWFRLQIAMVTV